MVGDEGFVRVGCPGVQTPAQVSDLDVHHPELWPLAAEERLRHNGTRVARDLASGPPCHPVLRVICLANVTFDARVGLCRRAFRNRLLRTRRHPAQPGDGGAVVAAAPDAISMSVLEPESSAPASPSDGLCREWAIRNADVISVSAWAKLSAPAPPTRPPSVQCAP